MARRAQPRKRVGPRRLLSAVFLLLEIANFLRIDSASHSVSDTLRPFIIQSVFLGALFLAVDRLTRGAPGTE